MRDIFIRPSWLVIVLILLAAIIFAFTYSSTGYQEYDEFRQKALETPEEVTVDLSQFTYAEQNQKCFKCHGQSKYTYENVEMDIMVNQRMYTELIISPNDFYISNHKKFRCTDCHSDEYETFPHAGYLRMEYQYTCMDCHEYDETYAYLHFEEINTEFTESVHSAKHGEDFTCWMCHNPHSYKINARTNENIRETIIYNNTICLDCHSDYRKFQLLTDRDRPNLIQSHDWIPNQQLHMTSVRCLECHTGRQNDTLLVTHRILPKEMAVKKCTECHSANPTLLATLYKYKAEETRSKGGFFRGITTSENVVIGASRNYTLNIISLIIFAGVIAGLVFHTTLRIIKK